VNTVEGHEMPDISRVAEHLLASHEGLVSMELVVIIVEVEAEPPNSQNNLRFDPIQITAPGISPIQP
jgi:uncharacterized protein (DUF2336 family)